MVLLLAASATSMKLVLALVLVRGDAAAQSVPTPAGPAAPAAPAAPVAPPLLPANPCGFMNLILSVTVTSIRPHLVWRQVLKH